MLYIRFVHLKIVKHATILFVKRRVKSLKVASSIL